jgi:hypothetical protein
VVHRDDGISAFCCASILHFGSKAEVDSNYLIDHNVGAILMGHIATDCSIQPQVLPLVCHPVIVFLWKAINCWL